MIFSNNKFSGINTKLVFLYIFCLFLGLIRLDYQSLWLDEYTTIHVSQSLDRIIMFCHAFPEQHPLYYIIVLATSAYKSIYTVRLISLFFGVATIFPLFCIAKKLFSESVAFGASLLFCFSPFILYYNQEGRMYSLFMFLATMQVYYFIIWLTDNRGRDLFGFIIFSMLTLYTHFFSLFLLFSEALFVLYMIRNFNMSIGIPRIIIVFTFIALSYLPWASFMVLNLGQNSQTWKGMKHIILGVPYIIFRFIYGYAVFPLNANVKMNFAAHIIPILFWTLILVMAFLPALVILKKKSVFNGIRWLAPLLAFLPLALTITASFFKNIMSERYLVFCVPFLFITISAIAFNGRSTIKPIALISYILPFSLSFIGLTEYFINDEFGKINNKAAAYYLVNQSGTNDLVLTRPSYAIQGPVDYYLKGTRRLIPFENWTVTKDGKDIWLIEEILSSVPATDLSAYNYYKTEEKVWPQENGLRLTRWRYGRKV